MTYNRFLYNSALYNAGREEVGAIIKSIIQAHTGPHIQAAVGSDGGISFISDFTIIEGEVKKPPTSFNFPDLKARLKAVKTQQDNLPTSIKGFGFKDLPASLFPVSKIPDLPALIFALGQKDLQAIITGLLAQADLGATIFTTVKDLAATMSGFLAPKLKGRIFGQEPGNLGARIHAPLDLGGLVGAVSISDLAAIMSGEFPGDLSARIGPTLFDPVLKGIIKGLMSDTFDLPATIVETLVDLSATVTSVGAIGAIANLNAIIDTNVGLNQLLSGIINIISIKNLPALLTGFADGARDKRLFANIAAVANLPDLAAILTANANLGNLPALIDSGRRIKDLNASIRVAETFITAILTINTLASRDLRATIGNPTCAGGSANLNLLASTFAQQKGDLAAAVQSFAEFNLGATINSGDVVHVFNFINVLFSPTRVRNTIFNVTNAINVLFSPFRGLNLGASIIGELAGLNLGASITPGLPLPRVSPFTNRLTAADLRLDRDLNIQEVRLQLEGNLTEYFYVNGTDDAFIIDANKDWKINVRAFKPIAANLFGDFAAAKICKLGDLTSFSNLDEAVRFCIQAVLGFEDEKNLLAIITGTGSFSGLPATIDIIDKFGDLTGQINQVFSDSLGASLTPMPA